MGWCKLGLQTLVDDRKQDFWGCQYCLTRSRTRSQSGLVSNLRRERRRRHQQRPLQAAKWHQHFINWVTWKFGYGILRTCSFIFWFQHLWEILFRQPAFPFTFVYLFRVVAVCFDETSLRYCDEGECFQQQLAFYFDVDSSTSSQCTDSGNFWTLNLNIWYVIELSDSTAYTQDYKYTEREREIVNYTWHDSIWLHQHRAHKGRVSDRAGMQAWMFLLSFEPSEGLEITARQDEVRRTYRRRQLRCLFWGHNLHPCLKTPVFPVNIYIYIHTSYRHGETFSR